MENKLFQKAMRLKKSEQNKILKMHEKYNKKFVEAGEKINELYDQIESLENMREAIKKEYEDARNKYLEALE